MSTIETENSARMKRIFDALITRYAELRAEFFTPSSALYFSLHDCRDAFQLTPAEFADLRELSRTSFDAAGRLKYGNEAAA